jgi:DNA-binding MarR family transcriptional regulator
MIGMAKRPQRRSPTTEPISNSEEGSLLGRDFITAVVAFHELVSRRLGVSATDRKCLDLISRGPVTAGELARFTGLTTGAVTGIIDRLVKAGYAERVSDLDDRRRVLVARKSNSRLDKVLPAIFGPLGNDMSEVTASYTARELSLISDFLARTREVLVANTARVERELKRR